MVCRQTQRHGDDAAGGSWWITTNNARDCVGCDVTLKRGSRVVAPIPRQRAITVIFFEYTGGLCGMCMSSPMSSCNVCLPGGN